MIGKFEQNILIDSLQRIYKSQPTNNYTIRLAERIQIENDSKVNMLYANIPSSYYNLTATVNMPMNDGVPSTLVLQPGNYTRASLITAMNTNLQAQDPGYLVSYDNDSLKITITNTTPLNFDLQFATFTQLARLLGFEETNLSGNNTYTGTLVPQLLKRYAIIDISGSSASHTDSIGIFKYMVPLNNPRTDLNILTANADFHQTTDLTYVSQFDIAIKDENGDLLDLNGGDNYFVLGVRN